MTSEQESAEALLGRTRNFVEEHLELYLSSGGAQGHIMGFAHVGVDGYLPSLLLATVGRRTGRRSIVPLIYGCWGGEWAVVGSKGGAEDHPAWYLNLQAQDEVVFQVATQAFRARWRSPQEGEQAALWDYMENLFPPYRQYRSAVTHRSIPLVLLQPVEAAPILKRD
jgi:deazaflavin-dependent oxidoreductase (nitroreductase family)